MAVKKKKAKKAARKAPARKAKKATRKSTKKASKRPATKVARRPAKKTAKKASKSTGKKATRAPARKAPARKTAPKKKKQTVGEGDYEASRAFLKDQSSFVEKNKASIPAMGREAEEALDGPEGNDLRAAEADAAGRSRDMP